MGYRKWGLNQGDSYQYLVARLRVATMLVAYAEDTDGAVEMASESPVAEWDDIVEFGAKTGDMVAVHRQVKRQYTDFKNSSKDPFPALFKAAGEIIAGADPYVGRPIASANRTFVFVFPVGDLKNSTGDDLAHLRKLLDFARAGGAAAKVVANRGKHFGDGDDGDARRRWLETVRRAAGTDALAASILEQVRVEICDALSLRDQVLERLASLFDEPQVASDAIDREIRALPPEGVLTAEALMGRLALARPREHVKKVRLREHDDVYSVSSALSPSSDDVQEAARSAVRRVWASEDPFTVQLEFGPPPPPAGNDLRSACVRLLLHAPRTPVYAKASSLWWERCKADVRATAACKPGQVALRQEHFRDVVPPVRLCAQHSWPPSVLAAALQAAMNVEVWAAIRSDARSRVVAAQHVIHRFDEVAGWLECVPDFFERALRGWWGDELRVCGTSRAGPNVAARVAEVLEGIAVLHELGYRVSAPLQPEAVGSVGSIPIRALVLDDSAGSLDNLLAPVALAQHAHDIVAYAGFVLLASEVDPAEIYDTLNLPRVGSVGAPAGMQSAAGPALVIKAGTLVRRYTIHGPIAARTWLEKQCEERATQHIAALQAALEQWGESSAA